MKPSQIKLGALLCLAAVNLCCSAQTNLFHGSWKLDPASKKFDGTNFTMASDATSFTTTTAPNHPSKTVCDGQPRPDPSGTPATCRKSGSGYTIDTDKPESHDTISLSPDGNTLTHHIEYVASDGKRGTIIQTSKRVSGGPGIDGEWHPIGFDILPDPGIVTIAIDGDTVQFKESNQDKPTTYKLDQTEVSSPDGSAGSAKLVDPHTFKMTYSRNGIMTQENTFVVSDDGKTLTETDISPEPNRSTFSAVYHKP